MARPIICGVDDSDGAREAVRVARDLGDRLGGPLVLVHVAPTYVPPGTSAVPRGRSRLLEREKLDAESLLAQQTVEMRLEGSVQRRAALVDPAETLLDVARAERAELIVLGSRGRGPLSSALLGSVSAAVAAAAPCPVVIVPPSAARQPAQRRQGEEGAKA